MARAGRFTLVAVLLAIGAALRAVALPLPGSPDVDSWKIWTFAGATDITGFYGVGGTPPERRLLHWQGMQGTTEYPPLALYELAAVGRVYRQVNPTYDDSKTLTALVKAPGAAAELLFVALMLTWGRRMMGDRAVWTAMAVWLNPAMILNGSVLGYLDPQMAIPATVALLAASAGWPGLAGVLAAVAVLTKPQAVFIVPFVLIAALYRERRPNPRAGLLALAGLAAAAAAILLPIAARGAWPNMVQAMARLGAHDMLSGQATNAWWLVTWIVRAEYALDHGWWAALTMPVRILGITRFKEIGYPDPKLIGTALVLLAWAWGLWRLRRGGSPGAIALTAAWAVFAYFMLGAQVHENHLLLAVPVAALAAGLDRALTPAFVALTCATALDMYAFYGLGAGYPPLVARTATRIDLTVILSVVNVILFMWMTGLVFWTTSRTPARRSEDLTSWLKVHGV